MRNICVALLLTATFIAASRSYALEIEGSLPIDGGIHFQKDGKAGISFFYRHRQKIDQRVKIEISTSSKFNKIEREFSPKGRSFFWRCEMTGKIYWRLVLQAGDGKTLATTPVKSFVVVPAPVSTIELEQASPLDFPAEGLDFKWSERIEARVMFYRFKLAEDTTFDHPLVNVDGLRRAYHVGSLAPGHYFWKVGVKYSRSLPIVYSALREFTVRGSAGPAARMVDNDRDAESDDTLDTEPVEPPVPPAAYNPDSGNAPPKDQVPSVNLTTRQQATAAPIVAAMKPQPPPAPPELVQPVDHGQIETVDVDKSIMLQWNSRGEPGKFLVEIAQNQEFTTAQRFTCNEMRLSVILQTGQWSWRVTAIDGRGQRSSPSILRNFSVVPKKMEITLLSPEKDRQFTYSKRPPAVLFAWRLAAAQDESFIYRLQVARNNSWRDLVVDREIGAESAIIDDIADGSYLWRVGVQVARNAPIQYSESMSFQVIKKISFAAAPQLTDPADGIKLESASKDLPIALRWTIPTPTSGFVIELADNENFKNAERFSSLSPGLDLKRGVGHFFWRVKALDEAGEEGTFSPARDFTVTRASQSITLEEPSAGARVGSFRVSFKWQPLGGCVSYKLTVSADGTMASPLRELECKDTSVQTKLDDEDTYFWTVTCSTEDGRTIKSARQSFRIVISG